MASITTTISGKHGYGADFGGGTAYSHTITWDQSGSDLAQQQSSSASVVTGINPQEIASVLYGKPIPICCLGKARIGVAGFVLGPWYSAGTASFGVSFGFPANPAGTRRVYEISLDGKIAWELAAGSAAGAIDAAGFVGESFTCRFISGTQSQAADALEIAHFGAEAIAYRPQMLLVFENLNLVPFGGFIPFVSCIIGDTTDGAVPGDGITLGEALERVAYSPWLEYDSSEFESEGVTDLIQGMILTEDQSFMQLLQNTNRFYRNLDILQTDKLRVIDRGSATSADLTLSRDHIVLEDGVSYSRQGESSVPRELEVLTIDPDADYVFMPSKASRPRYPVPVTSSVGKETLTLPIIMDALTRASMTAYAKYQEDAARKRISFRTMLYGLELEPGDLINISGMADGFDQVETFKVVETSHDGDFTVEVIAEGILKCLIPGDPHFGEVVLLLHFNDALGATSYEDSSQYARTLTTLGTAEVGNTWVMFGSGSLDTTANGGANTGVDGAAEFNFSPTNTSPYTIEMFFSVDDAMLASTQVLICRNMGAFSLLFSLAILASTGELEYWTSSNQSSVTALQTTSGAALTDNTTHYVAVDKDSTGKVRIYVDGVMRSGTTPADSVINASANEAITIGRTWLGAGQFFGHIDDVRITKGVSRYGDVYGDSSFPVPTEQFQDSV